MLYGIAYLVLFGWLLYSVCNIILRATGWTDPQERKAASIAIIAAALLNSDAGTDKM